MITQKNLVVGILATLSVAASAPQAFAASLVAPNISDGASGNSSFSFPFNIGNNGSARLQQVYASSQFSAITSPVFITEILFRPDRFGSAFGPTTIRDVLINLSTTSAAPNNANALSNTFADNIGPDETTVFNGDLSISSSNTVVGPNRLKAFDISIAFMTPFLYDPTLGNLLLDIRNPSGGVTSSLDALANFESLGLISGVLSSSTTNKTAVDAATGSRVTGGLITQFVYESAEPIPTPALLPGLIGMGVAAFRRKRGENAV
jgi:hypothetical protein